MTQRDLVRNSLRMRPDRIIIGEVRGAEVWDMLQAMNTGHEGSLTTIHANSAHDALARLEMMVALAGFELPVSVVRQYIACGIKFDRSVGAFGGRSAAGDACFGIVAGRGGRLCDGGHLRLSTTRRRRAGCGRRRILRDWLSSGVSGADGGRRHRSARRLVSPAADSLGPVSRKLHFESGRSHETDSAVASRVRVRQV